MIDRTVVIVGLVVLAMIGTLLYIGNDIKNDEISRMKKENNMHNDMVEVLTDKLNLKDEEFTFATVTRGQLYKTVVRNKTYEIYIDNQGNVIGISEEGTIIE